MPLSEWFKIRWVVPILGISVYLSQSTLQSFTQDNTVALSFVALFCFISQYFTSYATMQESIS
jgi:hypothetical protein